MIDMGDFHPEAVIGPQRSPDGRATLGRQTTTEEQRMEAVLAMTDYLTEHSNRGREVRSTVHWSTGDPTVLEVRFTQEHIDGEPVYLPDKIIEFTTTGAEIPPDESARLRTLQRELLDLHERGML